MKLKLIKVRLSYPFLFKPKAFGKNPAPDADKTHQATFLLDKVEHAESIKEFRAAAIQMLIDKFGPNYPKGFKMCLRDGMERADTPGYGEGILFIGTSRREQDGPGQFVDELVRPVLGAAIDQKFYAGCYVNATVRMWIQDNSFGKRINCEYTAMQFHSDGERFGQDSTVDVNEEFAPVGSVDGGLEADEAEFSSLL